MGDNYEKRNICHASWSQHDHVTVASLLCAASTLLSFPLLSSFGSVLPQPIDPLVLVALTGSLELRPKNTSDMHLYALALEVLCTTVNRVLLKVIYSPQQGFAGVDLQ